MAIHRMIRRDRPVKDGVSESWYVELAAIAKDNGVVPYTIPNEYICGELARHLRLPVPTCAIAQAQGSSPMFVSLDFNLSGESLPPINPVTVLQALPSACAGVLAFDILVANSDRHARNLSFRNNQLSMFDHGHALFGCAKGLGLERLSAMEDHLGVTGELPTGGNRHVFLDLLKSDAELAEWMERIGNVPDYVVDDVVDGAEPFGLTADEANTGKSFLKKRRSSLRKMVGDHRGQFRGIAGWSLFP